jgi:hypothetical protein
LANWLSSPVSIPVLGSDPGEQQGVSAPAYAKAAGDFLMAAEEAIGKACAHGAKPTVDEVTDRLRLLAVALRQWAKEHGSNLPG